ncbi:dihydrofolate reductase protein [Rhizobium phage RHph_TM2_3B]|nr:dihydrofolate reductase protein [Rhizobium phage RHph_TM2_3B]
MKLIVAVSQNDVIGTELNGRHIIPWSLPSDMARFARLTSGHTLICGRRTYESLPSTFELGNRDIIILTRKNRMKSSDPRIRYASSRTDVMEMIQGEEDRTAVIGGSEVYAQFVDDCDEVCITFVQVEVEYGTAYFPSKFLKSNGWTPMLTHIERHVDDEYDTVFQHYKRSS